MTVYPDERGGWCLFECEIIDGIRGNGLGGILISAWVERVGPTLPVQGPIIHEETVAKIKAKYSLQGNTVDTVDITDPGELNTLPIVRFLQRNKVRVDILRFMRDEDESMTIFYGHTE